MRCATMGQGMAGIRFEKGNYAQAVQFCLKPNSLAGKDEAVGRQNWLLMEKAYLKTGEGGDPNNKPYRARNERFP